MTHEFVLCSFPQKTAVSAQVFLLNSGAWQLPWQESFLEAWELREALEGSEKAMCLMPQTSPVCMERVCEGAWLEGLYCGLQAAGPFQTLVCPQDPAA